MSKPCLLYIGTNIALQKGEMSANPQTTGRFHAKLVAAEARTCQYLHQCKPCEKKKDQATGTKKRNEKTKLKATRKNNIKVFLIITLSTKLARGIVVDATILCQLPECSSTSPVRTRHTRLDHGTQKGIPRPESARARGTHTQHSSSIHGDQRATGTLPFLLGTRRSKLYQSHSIPRAALDRPVTSAPRDAVPVAWTI